MKEPNATEPMWWMMRWQIDWLIGWPSRDLSLFITDRDTVEVADRLADRVAQSALVPVHNRQRYS